KERGRFRMSFQANLNAREPQGIERAWIHFEDIIDPCFSEGLLRERVTQPFTGNNPIRQVTSRNRETIEIGIVAPLDQNPRACGQGINLRGITIDKRTIPAV